jgi:hypothetical protein
MASRLTATSYDAVCRTLNKKKLLSNVETSQWLTFTEKTKLPSFKNLT